MRVLIVGSGGREHALAWKLAQSAVVSEIYVAPGNAGTAWAGDESRCTAVNVPIGANDLLGLRDFARDNEVGLTVIGPEAPLADGIVDLFGEAGLPVFGPSQAAAQLEASKLFAKSFMQTFGIPTAVYESFTTLDDALAYLETLAAPDGIVVKASGLAAGKGVVVCDDVAAARTAVRLIMEDRAFGEAGDTLIIEERLMGKEVSVLAFCDGRTAVPLAPARDHKRALNGDAGPNTGGMGAFAPVPDVPPALVDEIVARVLQPAVAGMAQRGTPYVGVLYAGMMLTPQGIQTLEFNCRFGDPETQVVLPLLENDLAEVMMACIDGRLETLDIRQKAGACATVVMASPGYPASYPKGLPIGGIAEANQLEDVVVFEAGTAENGGQTVTNGGRVLAVSGLGETVEDALGRAYTAVAKISFEGAHYRTDIGR